MLTQAFLKAFQLIVQGDDTLIEIVSLSLRVSVSAIIIASVLGLILTALLELYSFPGRGVFITFLNTFTGLPPVVVGLALYLFLSRSGPLGFMNLLYTPAAMVAAQTILAFPIVAAISHAALGTSGSAIRVTALGLGATRVQAILAEFRNARYSITASVVTAFGRVVAEIGAVLLVGGNIAHHTRVMTTAIALEADKGDFELAIALGIILLVISFVVNILFYFTQRKGLKR